jgi:hypothetical protein
MRGVTTFSRKGGYASRLPGLGEDPQHDHGRSEHHDEEDVGVAHPTSGSFLLQCPQAG